MTEEQTIITVSLNPAVDRAIEVPGLTPGAHQKGKALSRVAGDSIYTRQLPRHMDHLLCRLIVLSEGGVAVVGPSNGDLVVMRWQASDGAWERKVLLSDWPNNEGGWLQDLSAVATADDNIGVVAQVGFPDKVQFRYLVLAGVNFAKGNGDPREGQVSLTQAKAFLDVIRKGQEAKVKALLQEQPRLVDARNERGRGPLHVAVKEGKTGIVRLLLRKGAGVNIEDAIGSTPLHKAAFYGRAAALKALLEAGAEPNVKDSGGRTPLHHAVSRGARELTQELLKHGASVNVADQDGESPLRIAAFRRFNEIVELLRRNGARPDVFSAAATDDLKGLKALLENDPDLVEARTSFADTPLHYAAAGGGRKATGYLLEKGLSPNAEDGQGRTPLHLAAWFGHVHIVEALLSHGAKPGVEDKIGWTPLYHARVEGHAKVVKLLQEWEDD